MSIYFSIFVEFFLSLSFTQPTEKNDPIRTAQNYQNIVTPENKRRALSSCKLQNQLQWLGFGLPVGP
jgi:hypothetical protein